VPYESWLMRSFLALVIAFGSAALLACASHNITDVCAQGGRTGTAPHCILTAQCSGTNTGVKLDCTGTDGNCICSKNDITGSTVPYQDSFCTGGDPSNVTTLESSLDSANDACGWALR
jgi:hypothetical protein